jgi:hypothetical protein
MQSTYNKTQTPQVAQQTSETSDQVRNNNDYLPVTEFERESLRSFGIAAIILVLTTSLAIGLRWLIGD